MNPDRRAFLRLLAGASLGTAGISAIYALFHNRSLGRTRDGLILRDFRSGLEPDLPVMAVAHHEDVTAAISGAIDALGGMRQFVKAGDIVLLKPNVGFDRPPSFGATTSPEAVGAVVKSCREAGAKEIWVTDNPINNPVRCFKASGIGEAVEAAGGRVILPSESVMDRISLGGMVLTSWVGLAGVLGRVDRLIGIPTVKDHNLAGISVAMKNWYGFLGRGRNAFHQRLAEVIADLAAAFTPTLVIVDGSRSLVRNGPTGGRLSDLVDTHAVAVGQDQVALDSWAAELMGRVAETIPSIRNAEDRGIGVSAWRTLDPVFVEP
jgi:uncharacterized protein (DUF362 family)